jgi:ADP-heptose:LPS heptosyltransferase
MTDPRNLRYFIIKYLGILPRWASSTSTFGMSDHYDKFCVASEGYRDHFISSGAKAEKIVVTGIPNFDDCAKYLNNSFPHKGYVLVCTSDMRETKRLENRKWFIRYCLSIARGKQIIFKLHPNENFERAKAEIRRYAPDALVYTDGSAEEMVANCDTLITRYSSVVLVAAALGKKVYSDLKPGVLKKLTPLQNHAAAQNIADVCREVLEEKHVSTPVISKRKRKAFTTLAGFGTIKLGWRRASGSAI